jgi:hypothetical protein
MEENTMENANIYNYLAEKYNINPNEENKLILAIEDYKDKKQDSRITELGKLVNKIHSWILIIGCFYLITLISAILTFIIGGTTIINILQSLF